MVGYIPEDIIEEIRSRTDIVEVVSEYIPLKRAGRNFKALCPFHHEKTPSFMVNPDKQIYHCFGCQEGGNVFGFIMKYDNLDFPEVARLLASKAGVHIPVSNGDGRKASLLQDVLAANLEALSYYHNILVKSAPGKNAQTYLKKREITEETIETFKLGFALDAWDGLVKHARESGISEEALLSAGLILARNEGPYDRFRNRIIFPILDFRNRVVGFGGRALDDKATPKYMNSPETVAYKKQREIYGFNLSKEHIRNEGSALIVEGYMDLLILYQAGIRNVGATCGTALTTQQARLLKRYTENITLIYDADEAGEEATVRGLEILMEEGLNVNIAVLPRGEDPDSFLSKNGKQEMEKLITNARNLFVYRLELLRSRYNENIPEEKAKIADEMLSTLIHIKDAVVRQEYVRKLSEEIRVSEEILLKKARNIKVAAPERRAYESRKTPADVRPAEKMLIGLMLEEPAFISRAREALKKEDFLNPGMRKALEILYKKEAAGDAISPGGLMCYLEDDVNRIISETLSHITEMKDREKAFGDCLKTIEGNNLKRRGNELEEEIKLAWARGDKPEVNRLLVEHNRLIKNTRG